MITDKFKHELIYIISFLLFVSFCGWDIQRGLEVRAESQVEELLTEEVSANSDANEASQPTTTPEPTLEPTTTPQNPYLEWGDVAKGWEEVTQEIKDVWGDDSYIGLRIAHCESRFNKNALHVNTDGSVDTSVFQINNKWNSKRGNLLDWKENIRIAKEIYDEQGGNPWVCYQRFSGGW